MNDNIEILDKDITCVKIQTGKSASNQGHLKISINETPKDRADSYINKSTTWFKHGAIVENKCFENFYEIAIQNNNIDAWKGTITVTVNGEEVPLTCVGCSGSPFLKDIVVDGDSDSKQLADSWCLNGKTCSLTWIILGNLLHLVYSCLEKIIYCY